VAVGSLEWLSARAAESQIAGVAVPAAPSGSAHGPALAERSTATPFATTAPTVDSSVERYQRMRARLQLGAGS
jgi:hypothetical protein